MRFPFTADSTISRLAYLQGDRSAARFVPLVFTHPINNPRRTGRLIAGVKSEGCPISEVGLGPWMKGALIVAVLGACGWVCGLLPIFRIKLPLPFHLPRLENAKTTKIQGGN